MEQALFKLAFDFIVWTRRLSLPQYLDGWRGVEHVLQTEVAAAAQVFFAELLDELQVVEAVGQRHVLLQADIWESGGSHCVKTEGNKLKALSLLSLFIFSAVLLIFFFAEGLR